MDAATLTSPFLPLTTLEPTAPMDDLEPLAGLIGDARVVAIGETVHYGHEFYLLRHRLSRFLVERLGFSAVAMESGFSEGLLVDEWIHGGPGEVYEVQDRGVTWGFGVCVEMHAQLEWMRGYNASGGSVHFYGLDVPGSMASLLAPLDAITAFMTAVDPAFLPYLARLRELAGVFGAPDPTAFADSYTIAALRSYAAMPASERNELTGLLADLAARFDAMSLTYLQRCDRSAYDLARQHVRVAIQLDLAIRQFTAMAAGERAFAQVNIRDLSMADTVEWILQREERIVLLAHNGHIQRSVFDTEAIGHPPTSMMGHHLAARLGGQYLPIGTTVGSGETLYFEQKDLLEMQSARHLQWAVYPLPPATTDTIDGLIAAGRSEPGILDLRTLSPTDIPLIDDVKRMRALQYELGISSVREAFDLLVYIPQVSIWHSPVNAMLLEPSAGLQTQAARTNP